MNRAKTNSISDCTVISLPKIHNRSGNLTSIHSNCEVPFSIERIYYLYDIPGGEERGGHAHKGLYQLIVAASGSFEVVLKDAVNMKTISLNQPYVGLNVVPGIWRELVNFSSGAICLVLASEKYDEQDYIRDFTMYRSFKSNES